MPRKVAGEKQRAKDGRGEKSGKRSTSPSSRPKPSAARVPEARNPDVVIVGAGRVGAALARALSERRYVVRALVSRTAAHARRAAARAGLETLALGANQLKRLPPSRLVFITTPDALIEETAERLAALPSVRPVWALHASGALTSEALAPLRARGVIVGSMHPLVSVSDIVKTGAESLRGAYYCLEGEASFMALNIVRDLYGRHFRVDAAAKPLYHAAAVMAAGHVVALYDMALEALARCGLTGFDLRGALLPLLESVVKNLAAGTTHALTGSFARADAETLALE
ncbi:MAG: DUF2520 domain-containing protein [Acidobacteria bacterium]|nr:DUF2520 domain-containing protein [Acidobacteriota bacterium]